MKTGSRNSIIPVMDVLDFDEQGRLVRLIQEGDQDALNRLIVSYRSIIMNIAKRFKYMGILLDMEDLIQEGSIGVMESARRFNASTYKPEYFYLTAKRFILGRIVNALMYTGYKIHIAPKVARICKRIHKSGMSLEEYAELHSLNQSMVDRLRDAMVISSLIFYRISRSASVLENNGNHCDLIGNEMTKYSEISNHEAVACLCKVCPVQRDIILRNFGIGRPQETLKQIARSYHKNPILISEIMHRGIESLYSVIEREIA